MDEQFDAQTGVDGEPVATAAAARTNPILRTRALASHSSGVRGVLWPQSLREGVIRESAEVLLTRSCQAGLALAEFLYPEADDLAELHQLMDQILTDGLEPTLSTHRAAHSHAADLAAWLATPTWEESRTFLKNHPDLSANPHTVALLESAADNPMARQHLGILRLVQTNVIGSVDDVYDVIVDTTVGTDQAMNCLDRLDIDALDELFQAAPYLLTTAFVGPYLVAARIALSATDSEAQIKVRAVVDAAIQTGSPTQRAAGAARLRRIARRQPAAASSLEYLAAQLDPANEDNPG